MNELYCYTFLIKHNDLCYNQQQTFFEKKTGFAKTVLDMIERNNVIVLKIQRYSAELPSQFKNRKTIYTEKNKWYGNPNEL